MHPQGPSLWGEIYCNLSEMDQIVAIDCRVAEKPKGTHESVLRTLQETAMGASHARLFAWLQQRSKGEDVCKATVVQDHCAGLLVAKRLPSVKVWPSSLTAAGALSSEESLAYASRL